MLDVARDLIDARIRMVSGPSKPSTPRSRPRSTTSQFSAAIALATAGDAVMVSVSGLVDERFQGLGDVGGAKSLVVDISRMTRMTSFGVRQWLKAMGALPKAIPIYLVGCPTFFVDQLNMVLNFGGAAKVLTVVAPYTCTSCGVESGEVIDVLREGAALTRGSIGDRQCQRCN